MRTLQLSSRALAFQGGWQGGVHLCMFREQYRSFMHDGYQ